MIIISVQSNYCCCFFESVTYLPGRHNAGRCLGLWGKRSRSVQLRRKVKVSQRWCLGRGVHGRTSKSPLNFASWPAALAGWACRRRGPPAAAAGGCAGPGPGPAAASSSGSAPWPVPLLPLHHSPLPPHRFWLQQEAPGGKNMYLFFLIRWAAHVLSITTAERCHLFLWQNRYNLPKIKSKFIATKY